MKRFTLKSPQQAARNFSIKINISLSGQNQAWAQLKIKGKKKWLTVDTLIDTGFSSGLALPLELKSKLTVAEVARQDFELADGRITPFDLYLGEIKFGNRTKEILVIFTSSNDALAGIEFLEGLRFLLDLKKYKVKLS